MIKVFTSSLSADKAGEDLTNQFIEWEKSLNHESVEIINFHTTSNNMGWMLTIHYNILRF